MASETRTHYVARMVVERVQFVTERTHPSSEPTVKREVEELGNYTIKDDDLDNMKGRANAIMSVIEDFG